VAALLVVGAEVAMTLDVVVIRTVVTAKFVRHCSSLGIRRASFGRC